MHLAHSAKTQNKGVDVLAINMSNTLPQRKALGFKKFPTIRYYTGPGKYADFKEFAKKNSKSRNYAGI